MRSSLDQWRRDLRHAIRALRRAPGFTAMTVGTLGLAIGVNAGMFSVVNKVLLDPLPYANADRLLFISASAPGSDLQGEFGVANEFFVQYKEQARLLEDLSLVENVPLNEGTGSARFRSEGTAVEADGGTRLQVTFAAGDYFKAMGIDVAAGRSFDTNDHLSPLRHVVISRSAAALRWPGQDVIGKRLHRPGLSGWDTVIGVVDDVRQNNFGDRPNPLLYYPLVGPEPRSWVISSPAYVLKTTRAETIAAEVRAIVREMAPEAPMYRVYTMAGLAATSMVDVSFTMLTLGVASALA